MEVIEWSLKAAGGVCCVSSIAGIVALPLLAARKCVIMQVRAEWHSACCAKIFQLAQLTMPPLLTNAHNTAADGGDYDIDNAVPSHAEKLTAARLEWLCRDPRRAQAHRYQALINPSVMANRVDVASSLVAACPELFRPHSSSRGQHVSGHK